MIVDIAFFVLLGFILSILGVIATIFAEEGKTTCKVISMFYFTIAGFTVSAFVVRVLKQI